MADGPTLLPLGKGAYKRQYAREAEIKCLNRWFEANPSNRVDGVALLGRPGTNFLAGAGTGPNRANYFQDGTFDGNLFSVMNASLFMFEKDLTRTAIAGLIAGGTPIMAGTRAYLFICDGSTLQYLDADGSHATGTLTVTAGAQPADTNTVTVNGQVYTFKTVLAATPNQVKIGIDAPASLQNLADAINATPEFEGITYGIGTVANAAVFANSPSITALQAVARVGGTGGNAVTTTEAVAGWAWSGGTLSGGAADALSGIQTPDDVGIVSICVLNSYVLCAAANSDRIYFIRPGAVTIGALDFFTAESQPDENISLMTVGDQFWAFASQTTQPFYPSGDADAPFVPVQGAAFSQGVLAGTACIVDKKVFVVGNDWQVYAVGGGPAVVSNNGISERIRKAAVALRDA